MTTFSPSQPEILDRLRVNAAVWDRLTEKKAALRTEERRVENEIAKLRAVIQDIADAQTKVSIEEAACLAKEIKWRTWLHELNETGTITPVALEFDPDGRTIRWQDGQVKLGSMPCKFVKALYFAEGQQMTMTELEESVWGEGADATIQMTAVNLRKTLADNDFPYTVVNVINKQWAETELPSEKNNPYPPRRPSITHFALVQT